MGTRSLDGPTSDSRCLWSKGRARWCWISSCLRRELSRTARRLGPNGAIKLLLGPVEPTGLGSPVPLLL